jgi:carbamoyltransferase
MIVAGLNYDMLISAAAIVVDGAVVAATPEERLNRQKRYRNFPAQALQYCLDTAGISLSEVDCVAQSWNPGIHMEKYHPLASGHRRFRHEHLSAVPDHLMGFLGRPKLHYIRETLHAEDGAELDIYFLEHHYCHAACAFFPSGFDEAAVLTVDGRGERDTSCFFVARGGEIELLHSVAFPDSLGSFYSTFTEFLGFRPESDEWKVMALSAMAPYENAFTPLVRDTVALHADGGFAIDRAYYKEHVFELPHYYSPSFIDRFGAPRTDEEPITERHCELAAAMQCVAEEVLVHMLTSLHERTGLDRVCLSGGSFMNSVANGKIIARTPFKESFIGPYPDDSGLSIGSALYASHCLLDAPVQTPVQTHNYYGPAYTDDEISAAISRCGLDALATRPADISHAAAELIAGGHLVGWFQGRMEFGQRALGNRSILADPTDPATKDRVNLAVKYREAFRPFAPAILADRATDYFHCPGTAKVPFMERVYSFREEVRDQLPAVVHADGSGRLQTVERETNPLFHELISHFASLKGVPIVLNTSFNLNGEPVVCAPEDAVRTFMSCGLTHLAIGPYLLSKVPSR